MATIADHPANQAEALPSLACRGYVLLLLTLISAISAVDRQVLDILIEPIRLEFGLTDKQLGALNGLAYSIPYALAVIPLARISDTFPRRLVIAFCVAFWSLATTLSSQARSFTFLFAARMGVGVGEAGLSAGGPAMLSDLFPRHQRGTATSLYMLGPAIGGGLAYYLGGWAIEAGGWRSAFLIAGIPGLIIAPLFYLTVRNMPKGMADGMQRDARPPSIWASLKAIISIPSLMWMMGGLGFLGLMVNGVQRWIPAYLQRIEGIDPVTFGAALGTAAGVGSFVGHLLGGPLADLVGKRDMRLQFAVGVAATIAATMVIWAMFTVESLPLFYVLAGLLSFSGGLFAAPLIMITTTLPPVWARATATAVVMMSVFLVGYGMGPAVMGMVSDALVPAYGANSLHAALLASTAYAIPAALCFLIGARYYRADLAASQEQLARDAAITNSQR